MSRMSDVEALMWAVEQDPALRSDFCNLTMVDTPIDFARMQRRIPSIVRAVPKLGQRVVEAPFRLTSPEWVSSDIDVSYHLQRATVPAPGGERELLAACAAIADQPFDRSRPLWQFFIFDGLADGGGAMLQKVHHTITDGVGGLKLSLQVVDLEADPPLVDLRADDPDTPLLTDTNEGGPSVLSAARTAIGDVATRTVGVATQALVSTGRIVSDPLGTPGRVGEALALVGSLRRQVLVTESARSDLIDDRCLERRFALQRFPMPQAKLRAKELGGSLNDFFVTVIADALGRYHRALGSDIHELRMAMPINTRTRGDDAANQFTPSRVLIPIDATSPAALFTAVQQRLAITRREPALDTANGLAGLAVNFPTSMLTAAARNQTRTIDFATSNLRGSPVPLFLVGSRIVANFPLGPRTGCAFNISMMSYCDELNIGCNLDPAAITDPELLLQSIREAFLEL